MTTWDPAAKDASITLSNGNLTAVGTASSAWKTVHGTSSSKHAGKWYFRVKGDAVDGSSGWMAGVANASGTLTSFCGSDSNGIGAQQRSSTGIWHNGAQPNSGPGLASIGDYAVYAVDLDNNKFWATRQTSGGTLDTNWNNTSGDPSSNSGGISISAVNNGVSVVPAFSAFTAGGASDQATLDTTSTISSSTLTGFTVWDGTAPDTGSLAGSTGNITLLRRTYRPSLLTFNPFTFDFAPDVAQPPIWGFSPERPPDKPQWRSSNRRAAALAGSNDFAFDLAPDVPPPPYTSFGEAQQPPYLSHSYRGAIIAGGFMPLREPPPIIIEYQFVAVLPVTNNQRRNRSAALAGAPITPLREPPPIVILRLFESVLPTINNQKRKRGAVLTWAPVTPIFTPSVELSATMSAASSGSALGSLPTQVLTDLDPLWVALEVDLWDTVAPENADGTTTLRLSNRAPLTRTVNGVLQQYLPRLNVPIQVSDSLTIFSGDQYGGGSMFQQPLRSGPQSTSISWAIDPDFASYLAFNRFRWIGRVWRLYEGRTGTDIGIDVDADLTLVYTGNVTGYAFTLDSSPTATMQGIDASSNLDKSLVDDLYPADFPVVSLRGKPRPQLWGRMISIVPVLEDQANLIYRVSRTPLDDITELRVGGVPWRRNLTAPGTSTTTYEITQVGVGPGYVMYYADAADVAWWTGTGATVILGSALPPVPAGAALYTIVGQTGPSYIGALDPADVAYWVSNSTTVLPYTGSAPPPSLFGNPGASVVGSPEPGEWFADLSSGTVQLGSATGGAEIRVDAQAVGWQTLDTAALISDICLNRGIAVDAASLAQLHLDWAGSVGFHTSTDAMNCLDALDRITLGNLCWWNLGPDGAVVAGIIDGPENGVPEFVVFGSDPGVPLDLTLFPTIVNDPIPKELMTIGQSQLIPPAWRFRVQYEEHESPETSVLDGAVESEKARWGSPGLVRDWSPADSGFDLTPDDGRLIRLAEPRAQDILLPSIAWRELEAINLRFRAIQRILGNLPRETFTVSAWMTAVQPRFFQIVSLVWVADNARARQLTGGLFRIIGTTRSFGGGAQQLTLWGAGGSSYSLRSSSASPIVLPTPPPYTPPILPAPGPVPTPVLTIIPPSPLILDTTPLGTTIATILIHMSDGSMYTGGAPMFAAPNFDDGGRFIITGPSSGTGPYELVLNPAGPGLPLSLSIEHVTVVAP